MSAVTSCLEVLMTLFAMPMADGNARTMGEKRIRIKLGVFRRPRFKVLHVDTFLAQPRSPVMMK
jgi:hypothetical protein